MQVTADFKVYNMYLDQNGEEQRKYVGDIRDLRTISVKDFGGLSAERLKEISEGRFNGQVTVFPDEKKEVPMPPTAPQYRKKASTQSAQQSSQGYLCSAESAAHALFLSASLPCKLQLLCV